MHLIGGLKKRRRGKRRLEDFADNSVLQLRKRNLIGACFGKFVTIKCIRKINNDLNA